VDICGPIDDVRYRLSTSDDLAETARLAGQHGGRVITAEADTRDREALRAVLDPAVAELGGLDVVVANAAVLIEGTWDSFTEDAPLTTTKTPRGAPSWDVSTTRSPSSPAQHGAWVAATPSVWPRRVPT
ncbi:MAG: SDR family NAD(P)-dependent oxidoreductase, partial [Ilumatobacteraceae bacterium]